MDEKEYMMDTSAQKINWFPGHMAKTRKMIEDSMAMIDAVVEVVDARIPRSSKNPYLDPILSKRPRIIVLNKSDLADSSMNRKWKEWYEAKGYGVVMIDALHGKGTDQIPAMAQQVCAEKLEREKQRGRSGRALRLMIIGIPNVGKSTLINRLAGRAEAAKTGNKPGVTRSGQWIRLRGNVEMLDTPGILWPKFEDPAIGVKIACIGSIKDETLDLYTLSIQLLAFLKKHYPELLKERYKCTQEDMELENEDLLMCIGRKRGYLLGGGRVDWERSSRVLLDEFRSAKIGRITMDFPEEAEDA